MPWPVEELSIFYKSQGIAVDDFKCRDRDSCDHAADSVGKKLHHGSEAHVGSLYGEPFPIVVVSLSEIDGSSQLSKHQEFERTFLQDL